MLKRLPIFFRVLLGCAAIICAIVFMTYEEHGAAQKYKAECQEAVAPVEIPFLAKENPSSSNECQDPKEYMPWWYVLVAWPEGITTWAVIATGFVIAWQSNETRKAAKAAFRSVSHSEKSERAWLTIRALKRTEESDVPSAKYRFRWRVKNVGNTPARLIDTQTVCTVHWDGIAKLPSTPDYSQPIPLNERILAPGDVMDFYTSWADTLGHPLSDGKIPGDGTSAYVVAYGCIWYMSIFDSDARYSRFCEDTFAEKPSGTHNTLLLYNNFGPRLDAPPEYTKHT